MANKISLKPKASISLLPATISLRRSRNITYINRQNDFPFCRFCVIMNWVMKMDKELPKRKHPRLKNYNYSSTGAYFVTICTEDRKSILSDITNPVGDGALDVPQIQLTSIGKIVEKNLLSSENISGVKIDQYVIMPNHIHIIVIINKNEAGASPCPTLSDIICAFKSLTVRECRTISPDAKIFQTSFHDHIIRGEKDYEKYGNTSTPTQLNGKRIAFIPTNKTQGRGFILCL